MILSLALLRRSLVPASLIWRTLVPPVVLLCSTMSQHQESQGDSTCPAVPGFFVSRPLSDAMCQGTDTTKPDGIGKAADDKRAGSVLSSPGVQLSAHCVEALAAGKGQEQDASGGRLETSKIRDTAEASVFCDSSETFDVMRSQKSEKVVDGCETHKVVDKLGMCSSATRRTVDGTDCRRISQDVQETSVCLDIGNPMKVVSDYHGITDAKVFQMFGGKQTENVNSVSEKVAGACANPTLRNTALAKRSDTGRDTDTQMSTLFHDSDQHSQAKKTRKKKSRRTRHQKAPSGGWSGGEVMDEGRRTVLPRSLLELVSAAVRENPDLVARLNCDQRCTLAEETKGKDRQTKKGKKPKKPRPNYFVAVQLDNEHLRAALQGVQRQMLEKGEGLAGTMVPPVTFHWTLAVLHLPETDDAHDRAVRALDAASLQIAGVLPNLPLLHVKGLGSFGKNVIFATLADGEQELHQMAGTVRTCLRSEGLELIDENSFKPHMTLAKMSRIWKRKPGKGPAVRLSSELYSGLEEEDFGKQLVSSLQLCHMSRTADNAYYPIKHETRVWSSGTVLDGSEPADVLTVPSTAPCEKRMDVGKLDSSGEVVSENV